MYINFNSAREFWISTNSKCIPELFGYTNNSVSFDSDDEAQLLDKPLCATSSHLQLREFLEYEDCFESEYFVKEKNCIVKTNVEKYNNINILRQTNVVTNTGDKPCFLTRNATTVNGICYDDDKSISDRLCDGSILIHYCISKTQGEAQWRTVTPEDIGVYCTTGHPWERSFCRFDSVSSYSTGSYFPLIIIEDMKKKESWYFEAEGGASWFFEIYAVGGTHTKFLTVKFGGADERLGFSKKLQPGESFTSDGCVYGVTQGGFQDAVKELIKYKRKTSLVKTDCPLVFNDYMNCNWANESNERLLGLIDNAALLGAEVFCIDDGWQTKQGLWYPADDKFEGLKVKGVIDYIRKKNMIAGVWFEFETAPLELSEQLGEDIFLFRNDSLVTPHRPLANLRSQKFLDYLYERVDEMYNMGVRYIKNDHNNGEGVGATLYGESSAEGLINNGNALLKFIDSLYEKYPDLIIENCAGGAKRSDWGTLKHFHIQSTSDQEDYVKYTSIISGSLAIMPPEKAGIWCYPYPLSFDERNLNDLPQEKKEELKDGKQTIFNVVNGMMGAMYLSGRIDKMDEYNFKLLQEGVALYKQERAFIKGSYPAYLKGRVRLSNKTENALGLVNDGGTQMLLAVWNLSDEARTVEVDLSQYALDNCEVVYPLEDRNSKNFAYKNAILTCEFETPKSAILFKLKKK